MARAAGALLPGNNLVVSWLQSAPRAQPVLSAGRFWLQPASNTQAVIPWEVRSWCSSTLPELPGCPQAVLPSNFPWDLK